MFLLYIHEVVELQDELTSLCFPLFVQLYLPKIHFIFSQRTQRNTLPVSVTVWWAVRKWISFFHVSSAAGSVESFISNIFEEVCEVEEHRLGVERESVSVWRAGLQVAAHWAAVGMLCLICLPVVLSASRFLFPLMFGLNRQSSCHGDEQRSETA